MKLVSIIIPLYNSENYISETIDSCINQGNCIKEIIIIDDHSTDNSWNIVKLYKEKYPSLIKLEKNIGKGGNQARNYGFSISKGQYIQWLDADDILAPDKIENQLRLMEETQGDGILVSCGWIKFENNISEGIYKKQLIDKDYKVPVNWLADSWEGKGMGQTSIWLTHRKLIENAGQWNENLLINQDGEFFCRVIINASKIIFCKDSFIYYRTNIHSSVSKNAGYEYAKSKLESYKLYEIVLFSKNSEYLKKALARNYFSFIYENYPGYSDLNKLSKLYIRDLGINKIESSIGGKKFRLLSKLLGFENAIRFKNCFNYKNKLL